MQWSNVQIGKALQNFGPKIFWVRKKFPKKIWVRKKFWPEKKIWVQNVFGTNKISGLKILDPKKFWVQKKGLGSKNLFEKKWGAN